MTAEDKDHWELLPEYVEQLKKEAFEAGASEERKLVIAEVRERAALAKVEGFIFMKDLEKILSEIEK